VADDREVERLGPGGRIVGRRFHRNRLGGQAHDRGRVAQVGRPDPGRQVTPEPRIPVAGGDDLHERVLVQADARARPVAIRREAEDRLLAHPIGEARDQLDRISGRAGDRAGARELQPDSDRLDEVGPGRVRSRERVGGVERQRAEPVWEAKCVRLRGVGSIRVAVEVDLPGVQGAKHCLQVLDRLRGREEIALGADLRRAAAGGGHVIASRPRERLAAERRAPARSPQVDEHEVAPARNRPPELNPAGTAGRHRIPRSAIERHHRRDPRLGAQPARVALEVDADGLPARLRPVERNRHVAALCRPVELPRLGRAGREDGRRRRWRRRQSRHRPMIRRPGPNALPKRARRKG
jgi:hypothetical protein